MPSFVLSNSRWSSDGKLFEFLQFSMNRCCICVCSKKFALFSLNFSESPQYVSTFPSNNVRLRFFSRPEGTSELLDNEHSGAVAIGSVLCSASSCRECGGNDFGKGGGGEGVPMGECKLEDEILGDVPCNARLPIFGDLDEDGDDEFRYREDNCDRLHLRKEIRSNSGKKRTSAHNSSTFSISNYAEVLSEES